jgi:prepilin-type N-terminal cleavage/methylation domain-containing protein
MIKIHIFDNSRPQAHLISNHNQTSPAFTIVELLVVIVVIGILAAITIVSYIGITQRATVATIQSDLTNASNLLKNYQVTNMSYPTAIDCSSNPAANTICLKASPNNTFNYSPNNSANPPTFNLTETNTNGTVYNITDSTQVATGVACPSGFIPVPGSSTYGTSDFCVMKYAASQVGSSNVPISQSGTYPWVNISQTTAIADAPNVAGCTGCHLWTEAEYMTIAQNVLGVASNWSGGSVGSGYIYSGHNDNVPANALAPDPSDSNGYAGETNKGGNQRRTLTLSNGQVIWDMAGNVYEWTNATIGANQQPGLSGESAYAWKQWNNGSLLMNGLPYNSQPASTGITGITGWSSTQGIGQLYSDYGETGTHAFLRGGNWGFGSLAGVLSLALNNSAGYTASNVGFRVSR